MEVLHQFLTHPVVSIVVLLGVLVFVHEAGHFLVGKFSGIGVEIFSLGFGPILFGKQVGLTHYRISAIPLGGFVKFYGSTPFEDVPEEVRGTEFHRASLAKRSLTVLAGPAANFLLAFLVYMGMGLHGIEQPPAVVGEVIEGTPAHNVGLRFGDRITNIDGVRVSHWQQLYESISRSPGKELALLVESNNGDKRNVRITPDSRPGPFGTGEVGRIGISPGMVPAVISITDLEGELGVGGARTGDIVSSVEHAGKRIPIKYWAELERVVNSSTRGQSLIVGVEREVEGVASTIQIAVPGGRGLDGLGVTHSQLTIKEVEKDYRANLGLKPGERILSWNQESISNIFGLAEVMGDYRKPTVSLGIQGGDGGGLRQVEVSLKPVDVQLPEGRVTQYVLPVSFLGGLVQPPSVMEQYGFLDSIEYGVRRTYMGTAAVAGAVAGLFTGEMPLKALGGPISIAKVASDSVKLGFLAFFSAMAIISINLGLLNLLPIPVLDGGQLVLLGAEAVKRQPLSRGAIENFQKIGFVLVLSLVVMATYNDLSRFWVGIIEGITGGAPK